MNSVVEVKRVSDRIMSLKLKIEGALLNLSVHVPHRSDVKWSSGVS